MLMGLRQAGAKLLIEEIGDLANFGIVEDAGGLDDWAKPERPKSLEAKVPDIVSGQLPEHLRARFTHAYSVEHDLSERGNEGMAVWLYGPLAVYR
jgi:hypothetical protein